MWSVVGQQGQSRDPIQSCPFSAASCTQQAACAHPGSLKACRLSPPQVHASLGQWFTLSAVVEALHALTDQCLTYQTLDADHYRLLM